MPKMQKLKLSGLLLKKLLNAISKVMSKKFRGSSFYQETNIDGLSCQLLRRCCCVVVVAVANVAIAVVVVVVAVFIAVAVAVCN